MFMLTIATMMPAKAATYFKENYYQEEDQTEFSEWWGKGAELLGLSGHVDDEKVFRNVLKGFSPDGKQQLRAEPPKGKDARAGTDLTFSAPKSVSIAALVGGDKRLIEAHNRAVNRALSLAQERFAETRINKRVQKVDNLCVAKFLHDTNRELEPALHTHCFVMNVAQGSDGKWRSSMNGNFYRLKMFLGKVYQNELAQEIQKLGYETEIRDDNLFELQGFTRAQIEGFSERHAQILKHLEEQGWEDTTENRIKALFATRKSKQKNINREELREFWQIEAHGMGIKYPVSGQPVESRLDIDEVVAQAIRHSEERTAIFTSEDIESFILTHPRGCSFDELQDAINRNPRLLTKDDKPNLFATQESLDREKMTLAMMQEGESLMPPIISNGTVELPETLSEFQDNAVRHALESEDRVLGWVGVAGAGKTFTLKSLVDVVKQQGIEVSGFAPDASSAEVLGDEIGIETNTVAYHLIRELEPTTQRQLWIVDEAGKLSAQEAYDLLQKSRLHNAQVLLVGDPKQLTAVCAGAPFKSLIDNGLSHARLKDFRRQKAFVIARAVQLTYYNMGSESIHWLKQHDRVTEIKDLDERADKISQAYLALSEEDRKETLVISGTHKDREAITQRIRAGLQAEGAIASNEYQADILSSRDMTQEQKQHARFYEVGNVLVPLKDHNCLKRSHRYRITKIEGDNVTLDDRITLNMKALKTPLQTEVFHQHFIDIAVGDRLKWTRNNRRLKRFNGREFTVREIDAENRQVKVQYDSGRWDVFYLDDLNHIDHSIVGTVYSSQGKTCDRVLISFGTDPTVNRESILVALSRARYEAFLWTSNIRELAELADVSNNQQNPSELLKEQGIKLPPPPPPQHIDLKHWLERVEESAVAPEVAAVNVVTLADQEVLDRLLARDFEKRGSGQYWTEPMKRVRDGSIRVKACNLKTRREFSLWAKCPELGYERLAEGGAWAPGGIEATDLPRLKPGEKPRLKDFGELKADNPRLDLDKTKKKGKPTYRKYEAPKGVSKGISFPEVPDTIAQKIFDRYGVNPTPQERESGFWACVYWYPEIEIVPVEGKKKAESVVSQSYAAIALPSITGGYRANDDQGIPLPKRLLHPELEVFATPGRRFLMGFDQDTNPRTINDVLRDTTRTGELLQEAGCHVSILRWHSYEGKGIDDLIVRRGVDRFQEVMDHAIPLQWESDKHYRKEYIKLRNYVFKRYGENREPTEVMIDAAIAFHARPQDRLRILERSHTVEAALNQGNEDEIKTHISNVMETLRKVEERLKVKEQKEEKKKEKLVQPKHEEAIAPPIEQKPKVKRRMRM